MDKLIYLAHTRHDLSYAVSVVSQFMHNPSDRHMNAMNHIFAYLKSSPGKGIVILSLPDPDWIESLLTGMCRSLEVIW